MMTAHALWLGGWALLAVSAAIFLAALVERARERLSVKVVIRSPEKRR